MSDKLSYVLVQQWDEEPPNTLDWGWLTGTDLNELRALEQRVELLEKIDTPTAEALAAMIFANRVPSPWRDAGIRLRQFGNWLVAICKEDKALATEEEA